MNHKTIKTLILFVAILAVAMICFIMIAGRKNKHDDDALARLNRGYSLAFSEPFKEVESVALPKEEEDLLSAKNYDLDEFRKREIPSAWSIDYATIPSDASFRKTDDGYSVDSPQGTIRFAGPNLNGMCSSFLIELTVRNNSDKESEIILGVHDSGLVRNGYHPLVTERINCREEKKIEAELSVFEQFADVAPTVSVHGAITLVDLTIYRKTHDDFTVVEGEIVERSALPDPQDTDYPDCRYTAHFIGHKILSGMSCNKELVLSIDGFINKSILPTDDLKAGDKIKCAILPIDAVPEKLASIQEADDLSLFMLDSYLVTTCSIIPAYTDLSEDFNASVPFKSESFEFQSVFDRGFNPPIPDSVKEAQKRRIEKDLAEANRMLSSLDGKKDEIEQRFQNAWAKEKERFADGFNTIKDEKGAVSLYWRNVDNSFWCLPPDYSLFPQNPFEIPKDKLDALVAFKDFLESNGIQLIVSIVPDSYAVSSRIINPDFRDIPELQCATYVKQLSDAGVECPYEVAGILENYNLFPLAFWFPKKDHHPDATAQYVIAEEIADRLARFGFMQKLDKSLFSHSGEDSSSKMVFPSNCDIGDHAANEKIKAEKIYYQGKLLDKDPSSEILVLGNSFAYTPGEKNGQHSLTAFLSERMLYPVDDYILVARGPMTTAIQRMFEQPETFLKARKVVILHMPAGHCTPGTVWNNISDMDRKRLMLNGKKLVQTLHIAGNGDYANDFSQDYARKGWKEFEGKNDIKCFDDKKFGILEQTLPNIDPSKPFLCVVQTVRSPFFATPTLFVNGIREMVPAVHDSYVFFWQDVYFELPAGTTQLKIELQGKKNTLVGFNKVLIYQ